jgi:hypothetical protein
VYWSPEGEEVTGEWSKMNNFYLIIIIIIIIIVIKVIGSDDSDNNTRERYETSISEITAGEHER